MDIAVIGSGMSGLSAAWWLRRCGHHVLMFESNYKPGGRISTRRKAGLVVDHGERFFRRSDPVVRELIMDVGLNGELRPIERPIYHLDAEGRRVEKNRQQAIDLNRVVFPDGMLTLPVYLRRQLGGFNSLRVTRLEWDLEEGAFFVHTDPPIRRDVTRADAAIVACPARDALELTQSLHERLQPDFLERVGRIEYHRCFVLIAALRHFEMQEDFYGLEVGGALDSTIEWLSFEDRKCPGREHEIFSTLVAHATAEASMKYWKMDDEKAVRGLYDQCRRFVPELPEHYHWARCKRWEKAQMRDPEAIVPVTEQTSTLDPEFPLEFCGDYRAGDGIENAARSGREAAESLLKRISNHQLTPA